MYNKRALLEILKNMDSAKAPAKKKDIIVDPMGQWAHPGKVTRIPSNDITMAGVPYPVYGVDNTGFGQMMYPGQNYTFPGDYVDEYPLYQAKKGGVKSKKYSKSLLATNRLFKKNPMFKKKKYKGKTYDPMAMYFQDGGDISIPELPQAQLGTVGKYLGKAANLYKDIYKLNPFAIKSIANVDDYYKWGMPEAGAITPNWLKGYPYLASKLAAPEWNDIARYNLQKGLTYPEGAPTLIEMQKLYDVLSKTEDKHLLGQLSNYPVSTGLFKSSRLPKDEVGNIQFSDMLSPYAYANSSRRNLLNAHIYGNYNRSKFTRYGLYPFLGLGTGVLAGFFLDDPTKNAINRKIGYPLYPTRKQRDASLTTRDTIINLNDNELTYAQMQDRPEGRILLGGDFVGDEENTVRPAKSWLENRYGTFGDDGQKVKDVKSYYGIEDGKLILGSPKSFRPDTKIVPNRYDDGRYVSKAKVHDGQLRLVDANDRPIYQNAQVEGKLILHSGNTKNSIFVSHSGKDIKKTANQINNFINNNNKVKPIVIDNGRFREWMYNESGITDQNYDNFYSSDFNRGPNAGYNIIIKKDGGDVSVPELPKAQRGTPAATGTGLCPKGWVWNSKLKTCVQKNYNNPYVITDLDEYNRRVDAYSDSSILYNTYTKMKNLSADSWQYKKPLTDKLGKAQLINLNPVANIGALRAINKSTGFSDHYIDPKAIGKIKPINTITINTYDPANPGGRQPWRVNEYMAPQQYFIYKELPKFKTDQIYTFADRPNSLYKMGADGKMYIKNKDTGDKFIVIDKDYDARVKVLREGLASGKTKVYTPPSPSKGTTTTSKSFDCKNPPPTAGEVQAEVLAAGLGPTPEGAKRISDAAIKRAEWEKKCAVQNKPVEQTPPKQKVERVELIDAAPENYDELPERMDFSNYVEVDYPTDTFKDFTYLDENGKIRKEVQYYDVKPSTSTTETNIPKTESIRKWDAKANKYVTVEVPYNSVEAKRERAKKEYEARKQYGYRTQTILEPDPRRPGSFKTKEVKSVKYAGPENLDPPRVLYYNPETQEYTPDKFRKGGLVNNLPKAQTGSAGKLLKYVTPTVKPVTSFLSTLINPSKVVANLPSTIKSLDTLRNINLEGFGDRFEMANLLKNLNYVGPEFGFNDLYSAAKSDEALNTLMQKAIAYDRTAWRQVNPNISLSGTNPFGEQWSLNKAPFGMERSELENMILHGVDMRDPFSRGEYMATHIPINIYGLREGGLEHLPLSMGALYGSARPEKYDPAYGHFMYRIKQPTDFSTGDWRSWADTYIGNKSPIFMDGTFNYSAMKENPQSVFFDSGYSKGKILNQDDILSVGQGSNTRRWASGRGNKIADVDIDPNNPFPHFYNYMEMSPVERALIEAERKAIEETWRTGWRGQYKKGGLPKAQAGLTKFSPGRGLGLIDDLGNYVDDIGRAASRLNPFTKINPAVATNTYRDFFVNRPSVESFSDNFDFMTPEQRRQALKEQMRKWDAENPFNFDMPEDTSAWALDKAIRDEILPEGGLTDVGGFHFLQLDDDIHLGNPWFHYQKEDFFEKNWRDIAKRIADEEFMKALNKKDMRPVSPTNGPINIGDFDFKPWSPGFDYMQKIRTMFAGPQKQLGSQDFFTNEELKNLIEQRKKYLKAREMFDINNPESYIEDGMTVFGDPNARDELFSLLFPNVSMPNFLSKFTTPAQNVKLQKAGITSFPGSYLERFGLERYKDAPYDNLQKGAKQLLDDQSGYYTWLENIDPKTLVKDLGYQLKLKKADIDNATPEQIEIWRRRIIDNAKQMAEERARKLIKSDLENPFKVSHFYGNLPLNKDGGTLDSQKDFLNLNDEIELTDEQVKELKRLGYTLEMVK